MADLIPQRPAWCPACGSDRIARIFYGHPGAIDEDFRSALEAGRIALGGCCVSTVMPEWRCTACHNEGGVRVYGTDSGPIDARVRMWILEILANRQEMVAIAFRQRARFEGWLKFELAEMATRMGATGVQVEAVPVGPAGTAGAQIHSDLCFELGTTRYDVELKTPAGNWKIPGILNLSRPITKSVEEIALDARKLRDSSEHGIVAFVLFPVPLGRNDWHKYLSRLADQLELPLTTASHTTRLPIRLSDSQAADAVICAFEVSRPTP